MKTVWIVVGVIVFLGLACCGGIFFVGRGAFKAVTQHNDEADRFCAKIFPEIAASWDPAVIYKYATPDYSPSHISGDLQTEFKSYKDTYGKFQSIGEFKATNSQFHANPDGTEVRVDTVSTANFEKGVAKVEMRVVKRKNEWKLDYMAVR